MKATADNVIDVVRVGHDFAISDLDGPAWEYARSIIVKSYWSGDPAPASRHFTAAMLWSDEALYVRFDARQAEALVSNDSPKIDSKTLGLWDRDVCEIFIGADAAHQHKYFEFEVAPTGEWVDLAIEVTPNERLTNADYVSGMRSAAAVHTDHVVMALRVEWRALGGTPQAGEVRPGNLFRCVGLGKERGYLAWQPTMTAKPNFHVPDAFGSFRFID